MLVGGNLAIILNCNSEVEWEGESGALIQRQSWQWEIVVQGENIKHNQNRTEQAWS